MNIIDTDIDRELIDLYRGTISSHYKRQVAMGYPPMDFYPARNIRLPNDDELVEIVQGVLESQLRVKLTIKEAELQTWCVDSYSDLHVHELREPQEDYNSLLYLNEDFDGGEFFTGNGILLRPVTGRLTFFNGKTTPHGVTPVKRNHRYTAIFWWENTHFL